MARSVKGAANRTQDHGVQVLNADEKLRLLKKHAARTGRGVGLHPDDIGVVRVEFTVPASRLFGAGSLVSGTTSAGPDVINDGDPGDDISVADTDQPPGAFDEGYTLPWPPGSEPDD